MNPLNLFTRPLLLASLSATLLLLLSAASAPKPAPARSDFGALVELRVPADTGAIAPRLVAGADGGLHLSWIEPRPGGGSAVRLSSWDGASWDAARTIAEGESLFVNRADFPAVCDLGSGARAAAWLQRTGAGHGHEVRAAFSSDRGATWSAPVRVHDDTRGMEHGFVSLVAEDAHHVRAIWLDGHNLPEGVEEGMADMSLHSRVIGMDGTLAPEEEVDARTCDCCPTSAVKAGKATVVAWRDRSQDEIRDMSLARFEGGRWSAPVPLHDDLWKLTGCPVNGPSLSASGTRLVAAWYSAARELPCVWVAFSGDAGSHFARPVRVDAGAPMGRPSVTLLPDGSAAVCWLEGEKSAGRVLARRVTRDGKLGEPLMVAETSNLRATGIPQVMPDAKGLLFAWTEPSKPSRLHVARAAEVTGMPFKVPALPRQQSDPR